MTAAVVDHVEDVTAAWLTDVLTSAGHDVAVGAVASERIGTGQMGTTYRLSLSYEGPPGPPTLIAKMAGQDEAMRKLVAAGYAAEVGFYLHLAPSLDVRTPGCWYGAISDDHTSFLLLLDDVAPAAAGVQAQGCTLVQAEASVDNLIGLHAPRWCDPTLRDLAFLMQSDASRASMTGQVLPPATEAFIERYQEALSAEDHKTLRAAAEAIATWQQTGTETFSVLHGDYRLDNLLFHPEGGEVIVVDWQTAAVGPPLRDVAYFLGTSLEPEARRAHQEALVERYHAALRANGVKGFNSDQCWRDYRLGQLQGPLITVLGCMYAMGGRSDESDGMFLAMARRSSAAIRDLRSLDLV